MVLGADSDADVSGMDVSLMVPFIGVHDNYRETKWCSYIKNVQWIVNQIARYIQT